MKPLLKLLSEEYDFGTITYDKKDKEAVTAFYAEPAIRAIKKWLIQYQEVRTRESERSEGAWLQLEELLNDLPIYLNPVEEQKSK
jgi:hypothetical protein